MQDGGGIPALSWTQFKKARDCHYTTTPSAMFGEYSPLMLQTQDDNEKRDMTDNYCRAKIPFTLKFDSPCGGTHN